MKMGKEKRTTPFRYFVLPVCLAVALAWVGFATGESAGSRTAAAPGTLTREAKLAVFDDAWSTINQRYYDRNFHGLDWEAQRIMYRGHAADAGSSQELYSVLRRMISSLNDSHTRIFAPEEKFDWWRPRFVTIGISVKEIGGLPTVIQVERDSSPDRVGIRAGDVIETVDSKPALSLLQNRLGSLDQTTRGPSRMRAFATLLEGLPGTTVEVGWKTRGDKSRKAIFRRYWQQRELGIRVRRSDGFAIVEIDAFTKPIAASFASTFREKLRNARGIILDFRSNGGGDAEAMTDVASAFLGTGSSLGQFTDRFGAKFAMSTRLKSPLVARTLAQTRAPVVVLASERTSSAAEIFIAALKATGRARIIGGETCGCVLAIRHRHTLPDGGLLDVSEMDYQTASGQRLEKQVVKPDQAVIVERIDLYAQRDRAMEMALAELKNLRARGN
jgi:C-terminal processing protease CtpA/Prc